MGPYPSSGRAYLPSLHPRPPQRTGEARVEGAAGLMLQRAVGVRLRGTSIYRYVYRDVYISIWIKRYRYRDIDIEI